MNNFDFKRSCIISDLYREMEKIQAKIDSINECDDYALLASKLEDLEHSVMYWTERTEQEDRADYKYDQWKERQIWMK